MRPAPPSPPARRCTRRAPRRPRRGPRGGGEGGGRGTTTQGDGRRGDEHAARPATTKRDAVANAAAGTALAARTPLHAEGASAPTGKVVRRGSGRRPRHHYTVTGDGRRGDEHAARPAATKHDAVADAAAGTALAARTPLQRRGASAPRERAARRRWRRAGWQRPAGPRMGGGDGGGRASDCGATAAEATARAATEAAVVAALEIASAAVAAMARGRRKRWQRRRNGATTAGRDRSSARTTGSNHDP